MSHDKGPDDLARHFYDGQWQGSPETVSGKGSSLAYTENLRRRLPHILRRLEIHTLVDAPCGDFNWMSQVRLGKVDYLGIDIVPDIIARNQERHPKRRFMVGDITKDPLPACDLMICRDCLFHLPYRNIADWMANVAACGPRYLMVTSIPRGKNLDIDRPGRFRQLDMTRPPFRFEKPEHRNIVRDAPEGERPRHMLIFSEEDYLKALSPEAIEAVRTFSAPFANHKATAIPPAASV